AGHPARPAPGADRRPAPRLSRPAHGPAGLRYEDTVLIWPTWPRDGRSHPATSTIAPGSVATNVITPYRTAVDTPWAAPKPAAPKAHAAAPSRGPQPPMLSGIAESVSTIRAIGSRGAGAESNPAVRA